MNVTLICYSFSQVFEIFHGFQGYITSFCVMMHAFTTRLCLSVKIIRLRNIE